MNTTNSRWVNLFAKVSNTNSPVPCAPGFKLTVAALDARRASIYYLGEDRRIHQLYFDGTNWLAYNVRDPDHPNQEADASPVLDPRSGGNSLYFRGPAGKIHQLLWTGSRWKEYNISDYAGSEGTALIGQPAVSNGSGGVQVYYWHGRDRQIYQLNWTPSGDGTGTWRVANLAKSAETDSRASGFPAASADGTSVFYLDTNGVVNQFNYNFQNSGRWKNWQPGADAPAGARGSQPTVTADGASVFYRDKGGDIHQLHWFETERRWRHYNLTLAAGGAVKASGTPTLYEVGSLVCLVYRGTDNFLHVLWWNGAWHHDNLSLAVGGDAHVGDDPAALVMASGQHVFYQGTDPNAIYEIVTPPPLERGALDRLIQRHAPRVYFHPQERYFLTSVESFLHQATLYDSANGSQIKSPTVAQLTVGKREGDRYWLNVPDTDEFKAGDLASAKAYVHARFNPVTADTDLQFWLFYAYNGAGAVSVHSPLSGDNPDYSMKPLGEHFGDWEHVTVRVDAAGTLTRVYLSQHSAGEWYARKDFDDTDSGHIIVYSSRHGHALYPKPGSYYNYPIEIDNPVRFSFKLLNLAAAGRAFDGATNYEVVAADTVPPSGGVRWLGYPYRWGPKGTPSNIDAEALARIFSVLLGSYLGVLGPFVKPFSDPIVFFYRQDDRDGPDGPMQKDSWYGTDKEG